MVSFGKDHKKYFLQSPIFIYYLNYFKPKVCTSIWDKKEGNVYATQDCYSYNAYYRIHGFFFYFT